MNDIAKLVSKVTSFEVTVKNQSTYAVINHLTYRALRGGTVDIDVLYNDGADYTLITASSDAGTIVIDQDGIHISNVTSDLELLVTNGKEQVTITNGDPEAIASIDIPSSYLPVGHVVIPIIYNSGFDYRQVKSTVGTITANGLELDIDNAPISASVVPNLLPVKIIQQNIDWVTDVPYEVQIRRGTVMNIPISFIDSSSPLALDSPLSSDILDYSGSSVLVDSTKLYTIDGLDVGGTITLTPGKVKVKVNLGSDNIISVNPLYQYVAKNTTCTAELEYKSGYSDSNFKPTYGSLSGNTLTMNSGNNWYFTNTVNEVITIAGRTYPVTKIGNRIWMTENLDYKWSGLTLTTTLDENAVQGVYYMNNESTYGYNGMKFGILYNRKARDYLITNSSTLFPEGWRIPTEADFIDLLNTAGFVQTSSRTYSGNISSLHAPGYEWVLPDECTDEFGFHGVPSGLKIQSGSSFQWKRFAFHVLVADYEPSSPTDYSNYGFIETWNTNEIKFDFNNWYYRPYDYAIRLVRDI